MEYLAISFGFVFCYALGIITCLYASTKITRTPTKSPSETSPSPPQTCKIQPSTGVVYLTDRHEQRLMDKISEKEDEEW